MAKESQLIQKTVASLVKNIAGRNRDIISRRFGLKNGKKETLEAIGKGYGITRERVRQIEEFTLGQLTKTVAGSRDVEKYVTFARASVLKEGGVMREADLFKTFSGNSKESVANSSLAFLLTLDSEFHRFNENDHYHAFWAVSKNHLDAFHGTSQSLNSALEKTKSVVPAPEFVSFARKSGVKGIDGQDASEKTVATLMSVSKDVRKNIFNEVGLSSWAEVRPKGVKDKAYLIMKKNGKPKHFSDIAKLINSTNFGDSKKVNVQTVHNELIKDKRFVLVGRGMYALSEWGYKSGTVKDVLVDVLKSSSKALTRSELVAKVLDARMVKENTILLNLQDSSTFAKSSEGTYTLRKA